MFTAKYRLLPSSLSLPTPPALPGHWEPSTRDRIEGVLAYSLLGAVACAMLYVALRMVTAWLG